MHEQLACYAGIGNVLGNKGAVAVAATYLQKVSLLFINSHFAAHQDKVLQRQADFMRIRSGLFLAKDAQGAVAAEMEFCPQLKDINGCSCDLQRRRHGPPSAPRIKLLMAAPKPFLMGQPSLQQQPFWFDDVQQPSLLRLQAAAASQHCQQRDQRGFDNWQLCQAVASNAAVGNGLDTRCH